MQGWDLRMQGLPLDMQKAQPCSTEHSRWRPFSPPLLLPGAGTLERLADWRGGKMKESLLPITASVFQSVLS